MQFDRAILKSFLVFAALISAGLSAAQAEPFNEVYDSNGQMRPQYQQYLKEHYNPAQHGKNAMDLIFPTPAQANVMLDKPLDDAIAILPTPMVLTEPDYKTIQTSSAQRARAILAFFEDIVHHHGEKAIAANIMTLTELRAFLEVDGRFGNYESLISIYQNVPMSRVSFWHGSDNVRDESGRFQVIEDNIGPLGGTGDVAATHKVFLRHRLQKEAVVQDPTQAAVERFLVGVPKEEWAKRVVAILPKDDPSAHPALEDDEDLRKREVLKALGVPIIEATELDDKEKLKKVSSGQISHILNFSEISDQGFKNWSTIFAILHAFQEGKVELMTAPGIDRLSNKALLTKMDDLIRLYLHEEPIVATARSRWVRSSDEVAELMNALQKPYSAEQNLVIKQTNQSQGKAVYILQNLNERAKMALRDQLAEFYSYGRMQASQELPYFVSQDFIDQSYLPSGTGPSWVRFNVDFRPLNFVCFGQADSKPMIWGRAAMKVPNSLTNVSRGAMEMVVTTPRLCADLLK